METLVQIVVGLLLGLVVAWVRKTDQASVEQPRRDALRERLRKRVREAGWILILACLAGCGSVRPAVYVPAGEPVRIARPIKQAVVEVMLPDGTAVERRMTIPAGWYALPDPGE
jgi:ABC-type Fe3+ transport system permease subunit